MNKKRKNDFVSVNVNELKEFLTHIINNNRYLQENGKPSVSIEVVGESGIGKTSSIIQLANELDLHFVKLNLAQIEEIGDLVGFPIRQFELTKGYMITDYKTKWNDYDLRIHIIGDEQCYDLARGIENLYYNRGRREDLAEQIKAIDPNTKFDKGYPVDYLEKELNRLEDNYNE